MIQQLKNYYHLLQALSANLYFGFSSRRLKIIGVTGTDGKTTTTNLIYHILNAAGYNASMISTIGAAVGGKMYDIGFHVTTPSSFAIQKYIKDAATIGSEYLVLETTSHALDQNRIWGIHFDIGVLTNITHEHLDYHKVFEKYVAAKLKLFQNSDIAILNQDDSSFEIVSSKLKDKKIITYGLSNSSNINPKVFPFTTQLFGEFNKYNSLAAISVCKELGIPDEKIRKAVASFTGLIGRQDVIYDKDFSVMIDFAHTPHAFEVLLPEVKKKTKGRLIHVFGSAGRRDATKRPSMGEISARTSDIIVLTADDPRDEKVVEINKQIASGIPSEKFQFEDKNSNLLKNKKYVIEIPDRKEAINFAIAIAEKGDFVVLTGKAHEKTISMQEGEVPWNEFEIAKEALLKRK